MNSLSFASLLSFLSPYWLLGIPVITSVLIYIYRQRAKNRKVVFGSLFLIKQLKQVKSTKQKLRLPLRLLFDLLLASLLILVFAGPYLKDKQEHLALVIDNSFSTQALFSKNTTRLADLRAQALSFLRPLKPNTKIDIWTSTSTEPLALDQDLLSAVKYIEEIEHQNQVDNFSLPLKLINSNAEISEVRIFTDKLVPEVMNNQKLKTSKTQNKDYARANLAISKLTLDYKNSNNTTLNLQLIYFAAKADRRREADAVIEIKKEGQLIQNKTIKLKAYQSHNESFKLTAPGKYLVELITGDFDAILTDNQRIFEISNRSKKIAYLGSRALASLNLGSIPEYDFIEETIESLKPDHYLLALSDSGTVLNLGLPSIFNLPSSDALHVRNVSIVDNPKVVSWDKASPYLRYLNFQDSKLSKALSYQTLLSDRVLIRTSADAILLASNIGNSEQIISGVDLLPYQGANDLFKSILFLNLIKQLELNAENSKESNALKSNNFVSEAESDTYDTQALDGNLLRLNNTNLVKQSKLAKNDLSDSLLKLLLILLTLEILSRPVLSGLKRNAAR